MIPFVISYYCFYLIIVYYVCLLCCVCAAVLLYLLLCYCTCCYATVPAAVLLCVTVSRYYLLQVKEDPEFIDTLDYIFMSKHWGIQSVDKMPARSEIKGPLPNEIESSDHLQLSADLKL